MPEDKAPSKSIKKLMRLNIINEAINKYTDLDQLTDLARAITIGFPNEREDLVEEIIGIWEDTPENEIIKDLRDWFDVVDTFLYRQCDDLSHDGRFEILLSLDGARFSPKYNDIKDNILKWRNNGGSV